MQWFRDLRTSFKILFIVAVLIILLVVLSAVGYRTSNTIAAEMEELYGNYAMPAVWMEEAKALTILNRCLVLSLVTAVDENDMNSYGSRVKENRKAVDDLFERYAKTNQTTEEKSLVAKIQVAMSAVHKFQDEIMDLMKKNRADNDLLARLRTGGDIADAENAQVALFEELVPLLTKLAHDVYRQASDTADSGALEILAVSAAAIIFGLILGALISRMITGPIAKIESSVKMFAGGDLTSSFPSTGKDELARMGRELRDMALTLKKIISSVKEASESITETAHEFSSLAEETNANVEEFKASVDEIGMSLDSLASTGEEVNASVEEVAAGAQSTAEKGTDIARQVDEAMIAGETGMNAVHKAVSGIGEVAKNASDAAQSVQELGGRTRQIQSFVAQIGGIADQTNLLALNAAIEAARAGEAGRGFAVVAEEVRKLAEDSNIAAKNIAELAEMISGDLDSVVSISLGNTKASQEAKDLSAETESIIANMITYLKNIAGSTQDLAAVSEEQAASSEEIAEAVQNIATKVTSTAEAGEQIRSGVNGVAAAAERMASRSAELSNLSDNLKDILEFFKLGENDMAPTGGDKKVLLANKRRASC
jgi:methyl-accepting chemotaxis protein